MSDRPEWLPNAECAFALTVAAVVAVATLALAFPSNDLLPTVGLSVFLGFCAWFISLFGADRAVDEWSWPWRVRGMLSRDWLVRRYCEVKAQKIARERQEYLSKREAREQAYRRDLERAIVDMEASDGDS